jgi:hypothetical protein
MNILGMNIIESPLIQPVPKLQLSHDFTACSDEMKRSMNAWLKDMFGTYTPIYIIGRNTAFVSPKHAAILKSEMLK